MRRPGEVGDQVLIYQLHEDDELESRNRALEQHLATPGPGRPIQAEMHARAGGCFRYLDRGRLGRNETPDLLARDEESARRQALEYMTAVNQAAERHRSARGLDAHRHPDPFPVSSLRPGRAWRVRSRESGRDDHWMTSWNVWLPAQRTFGASRAPVIGATVEVRVGARGQVVGVVSRVRPWHSVATRTAFGWTPGPSGEPAPLVYIADNPGEPQRFWSPAYVDPDQPEVHTHAHRRFWPACDLTVMPEIVIEHHEGEALARARILSRDRETILVEHGAEWRVRWSTASMTEFLAGESRLIEGSTAPLPQTGLFHVELTVEHVTSGAVRSTYTQVPVPAPLPKPEHARAQPVASRDGHSHAH